MCQIVEADGWQLRLGQQLLQLTVGTVGVRRGLWAEGIVENPGGERDFLPCPQ